MAIFEDVEDYEPPQVEEYEPPQIEAYEPPRRKKTAKKPTLPVEKKQVFTPKIPDQPFGKGSFRFETTPFRETPESYQLRSKEAPTGEERLRREEMLSAKRGQPLKSVRQATPVEAKELESAQAEQDIYDKFGPVGYGVRKGLVNLVKGAAEPFTQSAEEFVSIPGDTAALFQEGLDALGRRQQSRDRIRRLEMDRYVVRKPESLFERAIPGIVEAGGNLLFNPKAPKQVSGFRPPPDLKAPPVPKQLPPADLGGRGYRSTQTGPVYTPSPTGMEFALIPSLRPGKSPAMIVPDWMMRVAIMGDDSSTGGVNIGLDELPALMEDIQLSGAASRQKLEAMNQIERLAKAAQREGVDSISLLNQAFDRQTLSTVLPHETFHAGQRAASIGGDPANLYDPQWATELPVIKRLLENNPQLSQELASQGPQVPALRLAVELPAEVFGGTGLNYFQTTGDAIDHVFDNLMHIADRNGIEALDTIERVATIREGMEDAIPLARSMYENWQRERNQRLLSGAITDTPRLGELRDVGQSLQRSQSGGFEPQSGQARTPGFRSTIDRGGEEPGPIFYSQLEQFVAEKMPAKASADQAMAMLKNPKYGVKEEEYNLSQLDSLLARKAVTGEQVTKDELLDVIRTNKIEVTEKIYGEVDRELLGNLKAQRDAIETKWQQAYNYFHQAHQQLNESIAQESMVQLGMDLETLPYSDRTYYRKELENKLRRDDPEFFQRYDQLHKDTVSLSQQMNSIDRDIQNARFQTPPHTQWKALKGGIQGTDREIVLKVPRDLLQHWSVSRTSDYEELGRFKTEEEAQRFMESRADEGIEPPVRFSGETYTSPHFRDVENYIAHFRLNEMPTMEGKKTLAFQEGQSDLHQKGREEGYNDEIRRQRLMRMLDEIERIDSEMRDLNIKRERADQTSLYKKIEELNNKLHEMEYRFRDYTKEDFLRVEDERDLLGKQYEDLVGPIEEEMDLLREKRRTKRLELDEAQKQSVAPDLPFRQSWPDLIFKRLVRWAADKGYERIVWPTGKMQIDLYSDELRRNVDRIEYETNAKAKMVHDQPGAVGLLRDINMAAAETRRLQDLSDEFWREGDSASWRRINLDKNEVENKIYDMKVAYRLSYGDLKFNSISEVYTPNIPTKGLGQIRAFKDGSQVLDKVVENDKWLDQHVGPKIAQTLREVGVAEGDDLSIGGQLHKFMYDQRYPQLAKEFAKKYGGKYGITAPKEPEKLNFDFKLTKISDNRWTLRMPSPSYQDVDEEGNLYTVDNENTIYIERMREDVAPNELWQAREVDGTLYETQREGWATGATIQEVYDKLYYDAHVLFEANQPKGQDSPVHYLDLSPEMVKVARTKGFRLFSKANLGDLVKVKGYSAPAEVVGDGEEPGTMKVRFKDGTEDEFDVSDLKQKNKKIKDPMIKHLQQNPPTPPPEAGAEVFGPRSPLRVPVISTTYQEAIARKFVDLLIDEKIDVDLTDPPSKQIYEALVSGDLREDSVDQILQEEGVSWDQFIQEQIQSYSKAGRDLSILSRLDRNLERMLKQDPVKFGKYVAPQKQVEVILKYLNRSVLGRSLWSRYGGLIQKMVLTKLTTAMVNTRTTVARAIVDGMSEGLGAWMQNMSEGKGNFWERVKESKDEAVEAFAATLEVAKALNPNQLEAILNGKKGTAYQRHQEIITQLEKSFPDIHAKLFARPISGETQQRVDAEKYLVQAKSLLPRVKNASTRRDMKNQLKVLEKRMQFEKRLVGKTTLRGPEIVYDTMLIPMQFAEFLFRRPKFIGRLRLELMDRGIDLDEVLRQTNLSKEELEDIPLKKRMQFKDIPEEAIKASLNNTLELTYAYDPSTDKEAPVMERAAGYFIKTMNALGPGAILGELFPRAIYNGMKTLYEYSPAPFVTAIPETLFGSRGKSPIAKILRPTYDTDPKTQAEYKVNPPTRYDWERLAKAMIGSLMLFVAWDMIRQGEIGDEWWQLGDPTKKDEEGQSTYYDVRRDRPFSEYFHLASLAERYRRGTIGDKQLGNELLEIYTGIRRTDASPDFLDTVNAAGELFGANPESPGRKLAMLEAGGRTLAIPFTPILNLRDVWAIYSEEENKMKDTRGIWYGPIQDRFPFWRQSLPDLTSPIQPGPMLISKDPDLLMTAGVQLTEGPNFAGREWQRLGLNYKNFLERDPDPSMNRAQNVYFEREIRRIGDIFERLPYYMDSDDATKASLWEQVVTGDKGIAIQAQQFATLANPMEAEARKVQGRMPGRIQRKKYGLDKVLQGIRDLGDERQ